MPRRSRLEEEKSADLHGEDRNSLRSAVQLGWSEEDHIAYENLRQNQPRPERVVRWFRLLQHMVSDAHWEEVADDIDRFTGNTFKLTSLALAEYLTDLNGQVDIRDKVRAKITEVRSAVGRAVQHTIAVNQEEERVLWDTSSRPD